MPVHPDFVGALRHHLYVIGTVRQVDKMFGQSIGFAVLDDTIIFQRQIGELGNSFCVNLFNCIALFSIIHCICSNCMSILLRKIQCQRRCIFLIGGTVNGIIDFFRSLGSQGNIRSVRQGALHLGKADGGNCCIRFRKWIRKAFDTDVGDIPFISNIARHIFPCFVHTDIAFSTAAQMFR